MHISPNNMLYFDIETCGQYKDYSDFLEKDPIGAKLFENKYNKRKSTNKWIETIDVEYLNRCSLMPQFGKICCISFGYVSNLKVKIFSYSSNDESEIILKSKKVFNKANDMQWTICGYNLKNFDIPWVNHKFIKYGLNIPHILSTMNKKPWEYNIFDIYEYWNSGNADYISLDETCYELGVESPKQIMKGSDVHHYFWNESKLDLIENYCELDVKSCIDIYNIIYERNQND
jgi:DNA polymerase elongation subunit (family B)